MAGDTPVSRLASNHERSIDRNNKGDDEEKKAG